MSDLQITSYFGERDRTGGRLVADVLADIYAHHAVRTSVVMRAREGFGGKHRVESAGLEVLSLDLPLVSVATDTAERIAAVRDDVLDAQPAGLVTVERARLLPGELAAASIAHELPRPTLSERVGRQIKLTFYVGRQERTVDGRPAWRAIVEELRDAGVASATALLGVDGTLHGHRQRARFFSGNRGVPMMVVAVGGSDPTARAAGRLGELLRRPLVSLERVRICKLDGRLLARPPEVDEADRDGLPVWQKLTVHGSVRDRRDGRSLHEQIVRRARGAGADGATTLQGVWGYHGDGEPGGDRFLQVRRGVPLITTVIDRPRRIPAIFDAIDALTDRTGLVTSELVPARHATAAPDGPDGRDLAAVVR